MGLVEDQTGRRPRCAIFKLGDTRGILTSTEKLLALVKREGYVPLFMLWYESGNGGKSYCYAKENSEV